MKTILALAALAAVAATGSLQAASWRAASGPGAGDGLVQRVNGTSQPSGDHMGRRSHRTMKGAGGGGGGDDMATTSRGRGAGGAGAGACTGTYMYWDMKQGSCADARKKVVPK